MPSSAGQIPFPTNRFIPLQMVFTVMAIMLGHIWLGGSITADGGEKAKSNFIWMTTGNILPSAAQETEDYFCGSYNFENPITHDGYQTFCTPYSGLHQVIVPDGLYHSQTRFGLYRWHITDPIRFQNNLKVTIQALGWREDGRYLPRQDDIASVVYWYQTLPTSPFSPLPDKDSLEVI